MARGEEKNEGRLKENNREKPEILKIRNKRNSLPKINKREKERDHSEETQSNLSAVENIGQQKRSDPAG